MLHAGSADPPAANALKDLKGLWVEKTIVKHQRYHSCRERGEGRSGSQNLAAPHNIFPCTTGNLGKLPHDHKPSLKNQMHVSPMRKLQSTAAGMPTVSQDTMLNNQEDASRRKAFSTNMTWRRTNRGQTMTFSHDTSEARRLGLCWCIHTTLLLCTHHFKVQPDNS